MRCVLLVLIAACSHKSEPVAKSEPPKPASPAVADHGALEPVDDTPRTAPASPSPRAAHPIAVTLRSTPPGATAAVDGTPVGPTPAFWSGDADGHEHEFTFELRGYALARYRFVPVTSGVVHARLDPIAEEADAGISPETAVPAAGAILVNPPPAVPADAYVAPPPPIVPPADAAPVPIDAAPAPPMGPQP